MNKRVYNALRKRANTAALALGGFGLASIVAPLGMALWLSRRDATMRAEQMAQKNYEMLKKLRREEEEEKNTQLKAQ